MATEDEVLESLAKVLVSQLKKLMKLTHKEISTEEAENMLSNIGVYILNKKYRSTPFKNK